MAIKELDAGQSHTFPPTALRVQLTGVTAGAGVVLRALDQADAESVTVRLTDVEVVLTPQPRRLRLVAMPSTGGSFAPGTSLGLTIRTEGASVAGEQILVSAVDVGALTRHEVAILEFASDRAILTVSGTRGGTAPSSDAKGPAVAGGSTAVYAQQPAAAERPPDDEEHAWLRSGRYALREAERLGTIDDPVQAWGVVLDGSASMHRLYASGQLDLLLGLVCGTYVQWTSRWASVSTVAGVRLLEVDASTKPKALTEAAFAGPEPSSWSTLADATRSASRRVGDAGAVLIVTDGVPGDIDRLMAVTREHPGILFTIVTTGVSKRGLASDADIHWWQEELAGLQAINGSTNVRAVAVQIGPDQLLELSGTRAAELALRLTAPVMRNSGA